MKKLFELINSNKWLQIATISVPVWVTLASPVAGIILWFGFFIWWVIEY